MSEPPNSSLYTYDGTFHLSSAMPGAAPTKVPVGPNQLLLRGAQIRNTGWVYGVVINAGHETKLMRNATRVSISVLRVDWRSMEWAELMFSDAPVKRTAVERQVNMQILYLFILLLILSLVTTIGNSVRSVCRSIHILQMRHADYQWVYADQMWYLFLNTDTRNKGECGYCSSVPVKWY